MKVKLTFLLNFVLALLSTTVFANAKFQLNSPDNKIKVAIVNHQNGVFYSLTVDNHQIVDPSALNIQLQDGLNIFTGAIFTGQVRNSKNSIWENRFGKSRYVTDHYNEIVLHFKQPLNKLTFDIIFRAYNDGVAFRYRFNKLPGTDTLKISTESSHFNFAADYDAYVAYNQGYTFGGPQEWEFNNKKLSSIKPDSVVGLPLVVKTPVAWVALTEADLLDWSGMWITADAHKGGNPVGLVSSLAPHIQKAGRVDVATPHASPWRVLMIGREPGKLIESNIILNLSTPSVIGNASWVKPGISAWDHWWSGGTIMTTAVIKQYIQLAADMHWPYQLIDWQWYHAFNTPNADITDVNPALNMSEVLDFAKQKGVRLWVWLHWKDVDKNNAYKNAFALYEKWGLAGVKIDFMERDDQEMVNWYEKITKCAAEHHLMVDFHGAYKPTGFERTYPNQVTREGVLGNEYNIWSRRSTTKHKITLAFTRFLTGPADFTPGGFINRQPEKFHTDSNSTEVQGTRTAQLALFVIYNSPLTVACDRPEHYYNQPGADFLKIVPTTWDETHVLKGQVADYLIEARRKNNDWFIGGMTDENARQFTIPLNFLPAGKYKITVWQDAADSGENAEHLNTSTKIISRIDHLNINMVRNGGYVAHIEKL